MDKAAFQELAFTRNIGILSPTEQALLQRSCAAIAGMGGVGGLHFMTLTRMGVGRFHVADYDVFEPVNVNRQYGAKVPNFGRSKLDVMVEEALGVNPYLQIVSFPEGVTEENLERFLDGVHVVLDGLDFFQFDIRRLLFNRARGKGIPVITAGPLGFSAAVLVFLPHEGMTFDEYFDVHEGLSEEDKLLRFAMGLAPRPTHLAYMDTSRVNFSEKVGPSIASACMLCAAAAATEAAKILLGRGPVRPVPHYVQIDPYTWTLRHGRLWAGNRNPIQRIKTSLVKNVVLQEDTPESELRRASCAARAGISVCPTEAHPSHDSLSLQTGAVEAAGAHEDQPHGFSPPDQGRRSGAVRPLPRGRSRIRRILCRRPVVFADHGDCRPRPAKPAPPSPQGPILTQPILDYLINAGIQAPSGDNAQPWTFSASENTLYVHIDPDRDRSFFNVDQIASIISAGAVVENIRIAASTLGLETIIHAFPEPDRPTCAATLQFQTTDIAEDPLVDVLWKRCTNRKLYERAALSPVMAEALEAALSSFPNARLHWVLGPQKLQKLARLVSQVDRIRSEDRRLHEHLHRMIRFTEAEAQATRDGFPLKNLEAGLTGELFLRLTHPWAMMNTLNRLGMARLVAAHAARAIHHAAAGALLTVSGSGLVDFFEGGRALQRVWLTATALGLAFQPMAAVSLFWTRYQRYGLDPFLPRHHTLLQRVFGEYQELFPTVDFSTAGHVLLFRLGLAEPIQQPTLRRAWVVGRES